MPTRRISYRTHMKIITILIVLIAVMMKDKIIEAYKPAETKTPKNVFIDG